MEESKEFSECVILNSLKREKGDTKEFRRVVLCSFGKGRRETQKEFRRLVLGEFFLAKGEGNCHTLISSGDLCLMTCNFCLVLVRCLAPIIRQFVKFRDVPETERKY